MKTAIVCAYRKEESDLQETLKSATASMGKGPKGKATLVAVEDKDGSGPGANRHKGIEAAQDAEVIILIDAHMRFKGQALRRLAEEAAASGDLLVPFCHHNPLCAFEGFYDHATSAPINATGELPGAGDCRHYYAGARIVYKGQDGGEKKPLDAKWSKGTEPGFRGCVMGACYAFRRAWYYAVGQPLAMLTGWGGDEQALSIAAWMSGNQVRVLGEHVAHKYRSRPPWPVGFRDQLKVGRNQQAIVQAVVSDAGARQELTNWAGWQTTVASAALDRFREALLRQPRKWREWRAAVCEAPEINGVQAKPWAPTPAAQADPGQRPPATSHVQNPTVPSAGFTCPHCHTPGPVLDFRVLNTYPNGNRRRKCSRCGNPFIEMAAKK